MKPLQEKDINYLNTSKINPSKYTSKIVKTLKRKEPEGKVSLQKKITGIFKKHSNQECDDGISYNDFIASLEKDERSKHVSVKDAVIFDLLKGNNCIDVGPSTELIGKLSKVNTSSFLLDTSEGINQNYNHDRNKTRRSSRTLAMSLGQEKYVIKNPQYDKRPMIENDLSILPEITIETEISLQYSEDATNLQDISMEPISTPTNSTGRIYCTDDIDMLDIFDTSQEYDLPCLRPITRADDVENDIEQSYSRNYTGYNQSQIEPFGSRKDHVPQLQIYSHIPNQESHFYTTARVNLHESDLDLNDSKLQSSVPRSIMETFDYGVSTGVFTTYSGSPTPDPE